MLKLASEPGFYQSVGVNGRIGHARGDVGPPQKGFTTRDRVLSHDRRWSAW
jgi:hypothetical protein